MHNSTNYPWDQITMMIAFSKNSMSFKNEKRLMLLNYVCPIEQFDKEEKTNKKFILSKQIASIFQIDKW